MDAVHPLSVAHKLAATIPGATFAEIPAKALDSTRHFAELHAEAIDRFLRGVFSDRSLQAS